MVELTEQPTNAYRVLLTRARQGMVIGVPLGDREARTAGLFRAGRWLKAIDTD